LTTLLTSRRLVWFLWFWVLAGTAVSLAVSYKISTQSFFVGSDDGGWVYPYFWPFAAHSLEVFACACAIALALSAVPLSAVDRRQWVVVAAWLGVGVLVQALLRGLTPFTFAQMFVSDGANSFYSPTKQYATLTLLTDFDRLRSSLPLHAQSNMPGKLIFVSLLSHISNRPAVMAWLVVLISNLGGVPLYLFVRDLFDDRHTALFSLILYLFVPGKLYFFPLLNTVTPVLVLGCAFLLQRWLLVQKPVFPALLGIMLYALVFFDPMPLTMALCFAALIAQAWIAGRLDIKTVAWQGAAALITFAATYLLFLAIFRFDLLTTFRRSQADAAAFNTTVHRPYGIWVGANIVEFAFAIGLCQALIFCGVFADAVRRIATSIRALSIPIVALSLGLAGVLLAVDLSGVNRGEVTRLWIFLGCFFQIPVAYACTRLQSRTALMLILATTLLQGALGASMIAFVLP
jgi:hypothetical protein